MRITSVFLAALATCVLVRAIPASAEAGQTVISGGTIPQPIRFTAVDEDAFVRRINVPPKLSEAPAVSGVSYNLKTPYWPIVLPGNGKDRPAADDEATYYPSGGFVRTSQGGRDVWLALDLRQRAIIDRYVRLGEKRLLPAEPSLIDVLRVDFATGGTLGISVGARELSVADEARLWTSLEGVNPRSFPLPVAAAAPATPESPVPADGAWLTFTLPEGRDARLLYVSAADILIDYTAQQYYGVPRAWLSTVLGPAGQPGSGAISALAVPNEKGPGSPVWWVIMVGGGTALLGGGLYLRRRWA